MPPTASARGSFTTMRPWSNPGGGRALLERAQPAVVLGPPGFRFDCAGRSHDRVRGGAHRLFWIIAGMAHMAGKPLAAAAAGAARALLRRSARLQAGEGRSSIAGGPREARRATPSAKVLRGVEMLRILTFALVTHRLAGLRRSTRLRRRSRADRRWRLSRPRPASAQGSVWRLRLR